MKEQFQSTRLTKTEKAVLCQLAKGEELKPSEYLRQLIREAAKRHGLWPPQSLMQTKKALN